MTPRQPGLISLIITTYNRSDALLAVLDSLRRQTDTRFEVIVADDGSAPQHVQTLHAAPAQGPWPFALRHVWQPDTGFTAAAARNMGARAAHGDYLVFLDGDCLTLPDFVQRHRQLARPGCFVNGSRVLLQPALTQSALRSALPPPGSATLFWLRQRLRGACNKFAALYLRWPACWRRARPEFRWKGIRSCNMGVWAADFAAVNGFDETFDGWGHEDADFVLRLQRSGIARLDGFWATEVLHLWHRQAPREHQQRNRERVLQRLHGPIVEAEIGLRNPRLPDSARRVDILQQEQAVNGPAGTAHAA